MQDFTKTPSYFNNKTTFEKYLGQTSYYLRLQEAVEKLIALSHPETVLELGSATGETAKRMAKRFPLVQFTGMDIRKDIVALANEDTDGQKNLAFSVGDMCNVVSSPLKYDLIYLLYAYHHILDPIEKKVDFLQNAYQNMKHGALLCIAETFLPEEAASYTDEESILALWNIRKDEGASSTFWKALAGLDGEALAMAHEISNYSSCNEYLAGELVAKRQDEYLIKRSWLVREGERAGFLTVLNEPVNVLGDGVVLFKKK